MSWSFAMNCLMYGSLAAAVIYVFIRIKNIGRGEAEREVLKETVKEMAHGQKIVEAQRDLASKPPGTVDDTADFLSGHD